MAVRMICMRFKFANIELVPLCMRAMLKQRSGRGSDDVRREPVTPQEERCSLEKFDLLANGYELVDVFYQPSVNKHDSRKTNHLVYFWFCRKEFADPSEEFKKSRAWLLEEYAGMCKDAFWRTISFANPYYENAQPVDGQLSVVVSMDDRCARTLPSGEPVLQWKKDEQGERIGKGPVPVWARFYLSADGGKLCLIPSDDSRSTREVIFIDIPPRSKS